MQEKLEKEVINVLKSINVNLLDCAKSLRRISEFIEATRELEGSDVQKGTSVITDMGEVIACLEAAGFERGKE